MWPIHPGWDQPDQPAGRTIKAMTAKRVSETSVRLSQLMTPNDANILGKVFGGAILSLIDLTASACSSKFAGHVCVTASFDRVDFHEPIEIGELVELEGMVSFVGRTSLEVTIDVHATNLLRGVRRHCNTARVTMVALKDGKPTEVPRLICETEDEKRRFLMGKIRRETRARRIAEIAQVDTQLAAATNSDLDQLMESQAALDSFIARAIA